MAIWALLEKRIYWALGATIAMSLARPTGLFMVIPFAIAVIAYRERSLWWRGGLIAASASGVAAIAITDLVLRGNPFLILTVHNLWTDIPIGGYLNLFSKGPTVAFHTISQGLLLHPLIYGMDLYETLICALAVIITWRWKKSLAAFATAVLAASLLFSGIQSTSRYELTILPAWLGPAHLLKRYGIIWTCIAVVCVAGMAINIHILQGFMRGSWAG